MMKQPLLFLLLCLLPELAAQYPSASYRTAATPLLGEFHSREPPYHNPAFLGRDALHFELSRAFHLRILDMMFPYSSLSRAFGTQSFSFEDAVNARVNELVVGLSVRFTNLSSRSQMYRETLAQYLTALSTDVVPPLAVIARANVPPSLSQPEIESAPAYVNFKNRVEGDATTLLNNLGRIIGQVGIDYINRQPFFNSKVYLRFLDLEFLLGPQASLGFGLNIRAQIHPKEDTSGFTVDVNRLNLPQMSLDGVSLPTAANWLAPPPLPETALGAALGQVVRNYIQNLTNSLGQNKLGSLVMRSLFEQSFIDLYYVLEPNARFSFAFALADWLYLGNRLQVQLLWGMDNVMVAPEALDISQPLKLAEYMINPANYRLSAHAGWDLSLLLQPFDWWVFSLVLTDALGIAPSKTKASVNSWGDLYYPVDLQFGTFFQFQPVTDFRIGFGADLYEFISMLARRAQRFNPATSFQFVDHFRGKLYLEYMGQFRLTVHYWSQSIGLALQFDFLSFHPAIGLEIGFGLDDINIRLDILHFSA